MTRYREISSAEMTPAQKEVHDEIVAGRRGRFGGPFQILIRAPEVCRHLQRLGEYLRWGSSLPPGLSELEICLTARHLRAAYQWHAHPPLEGRYRMRRRYLLMDRAARSTAVLTEIRSAA